MWTAYHPAGQRQISDGKHVIDTVVVVGYTHRPHENSIAGCAVHSGDVHDRVCAKARISCEVLKGLKIQLRLQIIEATGVLSNELPGELSFVNEDLQHTFEKSNIATDSRLDVEVVNLRTQQ